MGPVSYVERKLMEVPVIPSRFLSMDRLSSYTEVRVRLIGLQFGCTDVLNLQVERVASMAFRST